MGEASAQAWERARTLIGIWNSEGLDSWAAHAWSPDIVWHEPERFPDAGVRVGRDAALQRMRERFDWIGEVQMELVDVQQAGSRTMIEVIIHSKGRQSGATADQREFLITEIEDGQTTLLLEFLDRDEAMAAMADG